MIVFIFVTTNNTTLQLEVELSHTIKDVKDMIQHKEGIPSGQQELHFANRELQDNTKLSEYKIRHECQLYLTLYSIDISVKTITGKKTALHAYSTHTVEQVKEKVVAIDTEIEGHSKKDISVDHLQLIFNSKQLEDGFILSDYSIQSQSTLILMSRLKKACVFFSKPSQEK